MAQTGSTPSGTPHPLTKPAIGAAAAALLLNIVLAVTDAEGAIWLLVGALGLVAAVLGWQAGGRNPRNIAAFVSMLIGALLFLIVLGYSFAEA